MGKKIALVTDSTCDISDELLNQYDINILPLKVIYKDKEYSDRVDITAQEIYNNLPVEVPTTSMPALSDIINLFNKLKNEGFTHIISIHISSGLSGTYDIIKSAAEEFKDIIIEVVDSKSLSMGLGFPVLETAKAIKNSLSFESVIEKAKEAISNTETFFVVATLDYLRKGGRIGHVSGIVGEFLNVKPIISIGDDGKYFTFTKVRGRNQSLSRILDIVKEKINCIGKKIDVAVLHGGAEIEAKDLLDKIKKLPYINDTFFGQISPVMGVHTGPGLVGVIVYNAV